MTTTPLAITHITVPDPIGSPSNAWIGYLRDRLFEATSDDVADIRSNNDAYPIDDYAPTSTSGLLTWLHAHVDRLSDGHSHVDVVRPYTLTLDGEPAALLVCDSGIRADEAWNPSEQDVAFALIAWLVDLHQWQDRQDPAA